MVGDKDSPLGIREGCDALGVPRATFYRARNPRRETQKSPCSRSSPRALTQEERQAVRNQLYCSRFADKSPGEIFAKLLDEHLYLCSIRTYYRILAEDKSSKERRDQLRHPQYRKPELLANGVNQVWSWDITKLLGPVKGSYFHLYVAIDIFSRCVVGWLLATRESGELASRFLRETAQKYGIQEQQLILHSDRGPAMKSQEVSQLLGSLGITKSHSRPHVSNDNPFSESQFKTMKYRPDFPERFGSFEEGLTFCRNFFNWYNDEHHHVGLGLLTPAMVHFGKAEEILEARNKTFEKAYELHPERFVKGKPKATPLPKEVWINKPKNQTIQLPAVKPKKSEHGDELPKELEKNPQPERKTENPEGVSGPNPSQCSPSSGFTQKAPHPDWGVLGESTRHPYEVTESQLSFQPGDHSWVPNAPLPAIQEFREKVSQNH